MKSITYTIEKSYNIKGVSGYVFCKDKRLYNCKTNREIKQSLNGGSIGYWLNRKFYTLKKLRSLLIKYTENYCPF